jgi:hypothetical protein
MTPSQPSFCAGKIEPLTIQGESALQEHGMRDSREHVEARVDHEESNDGRRAKGNE